MPMADVRIEREDGTVVAVLLVIFVSMFSIAVLSPVVTAMERRLGWSRIRRVAGSWNSIRRRSVFLATLERKRSGRNWRS